jgi:DNA helicase HerA-like ATPase
MEEGILIGKGERELQLLPNMANRHGLIAGATGTGKTATLRVIAEGFSRLGIPSFLADIKGDVSGLAKPGAPNPKWQERVDRLHLTDFSFEGYPVEFWDVFGAQGHPVRATVSDLGPLLLGRLLNLNETQTGVLNLVFKIADDNGLLLLDLKDLRSMLQHVSEKAAEFRSAYGNISPASIGAIQRNLMTIEEHGGDKFFGEPSLNLDDLMQTDADGRGVINILAADQLINSPRIYSVFLLWLMSELFENLPEAGDLPKPKLVFFFDEAHLLFSEAPPALLEKIEQVVRLIRSKGIGIYFITQNPIDIPETVLGQLGNRVQHALRAFTPRDQKAVKTAAQTFRQNPKLNTEAVIGELGVGEALVSFLDSEGRPEMVERAMIVPPRSQLPPLSPAERDDIRNRSSIAGFYGQAVDRQSAYEMLQARAKEQLQAAEARPAEPKRPIASARRTDNIWESVAKSTARSMGTQVGREVVRGLLGSILGGSSTRRRRSIF